MFDKFKDYPLMKDRQGNVPMFYPHIPKNSLKSLKKVLAGRWIGQGPKVKLFEDKFCKLYIGLSPTYEVYTIYKMNKKSR